MSSTSSHAIMVLLSANALILMHGFDSASAAAVIPPSFCDCGPGAISIIDADVNVDFDAPADYEEPVRKPTPQVIPTFKQARPSTPPRCFCFA